MQTPYRHIRKKQRERKQRVYLSLSPANHQFSLENTRRSSQHYDTLKRVRHHTTNRPESHSQKLERMGKGQYQILVRDSLRKTSNHRFLQTRPTNKTEEAPVQKIEPAPNLVIEGLRCGEDLINLNRRKLEQMISQIRANSVALPKDYTITEVYIEKYRHIRSKLDHAQSSESQPAGGQVEAAVTPIQGLKAKIEAKHTLICHKESKKSDQKDSKHVETQRSPKASPSPSTERRKSLQLKPEKRTSQSLNLNRMRKSCKTEQVLKPPTSSPRKRGPIFNGFNLHNLEGWQSSEQPGEEAFFHCSPLF